MHISTFKSRLLFFFMLAFATACHFSSGPSNLRSDTRRGNAPKAVDDVETESDIDESEASYTETSESSEQNNSDRIPNLKKSSETLTWKRYRAFEHGLASALNLPANELCTELGRSSCINEAHLSVLGGNEPYVNTQYERLQAPSALTPIAVERIVLAACERRRILDRDLGEKAIIFRGWTTSTTTVSASQIKALGEDLYRRFLARDPTEAEIQGLDKIRELVQVPEKIALSVCFVIGSQTENVFL